MTPLGKLRDHFWKTVKMSRALGVDLGHALHQDHLSRQDYAQIVDRCRACPWADGCESWMAAQTVPASEVPESCANHDQWVALRDRAG